MSSPRTMKYTNMLSRFSPIDQLVLAEGWMLQVATATAESLRDVSFVAICGRYARFNGAGYTIADVRTVVVPVRVLAGGSTLAANDDNFEAVAGAEFTRWQSTHADWTKACDGKRELKTFTDVVPLHTFEIHIDRSGRDFCLQYLMRECSPRQMTNMQRVACAKKAQIMIRACTNDRCRYGVKMLPCAATIKAFRDMAAATFGVILPPFLVATSRAARLHATGDNVVHVSPRGRELRTTERIPHTDIGDGTRGATRRPVAHGRGGKYREYRDGQQRRGGGGGGGGEGRRREGGRRSGGGRRGVERRGDERKKEEKRMPFLCKYGMKFKKSILAILDSEALNKLSIRIIRERLATEFGSYWTETYEDEIRNLIYSLLRKNRGGTSSTLVVSAAAGTSAMTPNESSMKQ